MLKKLALLGLLLLPTPLFADSQAFGGQWGGLNNGDASILIGDSEAQDLSNVDITDNGYGIKKRSGYAQFKTVGTSTWGVRGGYYFKDKSSNDNLITANNKSIFKSVNSGAYSAFVTTDTAGSYYDFTDSNGYLWRANSNRDEILKYDGTTVTYYPSHPKGNQIEALPDRLVISGTVANPNRVNFSGAADFTTFTTGINETDPFYEDLGLPGQDITAIKYAFGRLLIWTNTTMSFWAGNNQFDGIIQDISSTVGTNQPNSIVYDVGIVYWQAQDKNFYGYDGNSIFKISKKINNSTSNLASGSAKSYTYTSRSDWDSGVIPTRYLSSSYSLGDLNLSTTTTIDDFTDGNFTSNPTWNSMGGNGTWTSAFNSIYVNNPIGVLSDARYATIDTFSTGTITMTMDDANLNNTKTYFRVCNTIPIQLGASSFDNCYGAEVSITAGIRSMTIYRKSTLIATASPVNFGGGTVTLSRDSDSLLTFIVGGTTLTVTDTTFSSFTYLAVGATRGVSTAAAWDSIGFYPLVGVYISTPIPIGTSITSWGQFSGNQSLGGGSISYSIFTDTDTTLSIGDSTTFSSSQTITLNSIPTISTGAYLTFVSTFSRTNISQIPTISDTSINWYQGSPTNSFGIVGKNNIIYWAVAESTYTYANITLLYDSRFNSWLKYSFPIGSPALVNDSLYFGGVSTGIVYIYPSGTSDNGSAITSYFKTKDFIGSDPFIEKDYLTLSAISETNTGSTLTMDCYVNGSATASKTFTISQTNALSLPYIRYNNRFQTGLFGSFINFKFGNTTADSPFELYSVKYDYTPKAWRVLP